MRALAVYPLTRRTRGRDVGLFGNPPGVLGYVRPATGPDGKPDTSFKFYGRRNSYIRFPNRGRLDAKHSVTLIAWVYPDGVGPIFRYGVDFSVCRARGLCLRLFPRGATNIRIRPLRTRRVIRYRKWQYVGATYQRRTGETMIYVDGRLVARQRLRRVSLATNTAAVMGVGGGRYFRGRISCMQVYGRALTSRQIIRRKRRCFKGVIWLCFLFCVSGSFFKGTLIMLVSSFRLKPTPTFLRVLPNAFVPIVYSNNSKLM